MQPEPVLDTDVYKRARCVQLPGVMPGPTRARSPTWKGHGGATHPALLCSCLAQRGGKWVVLLYSPP